METNRLADPCVMTIFGAAGDLAKRLLFPAICNLGNNGLLPLNFCVAGFGREPYNTETYRAYLETCVAEFVKDPEAASYGLELAKHAVYTSGEFADPAAFLEHKTRLDGMTGASRNYLFYLATPPQFFSKIIEQLGQSGLTVEDKDAWRRVIIEKPFGHDLESAKAFNAEVTRVLDEKQIYRIDHYLGKETVQNLLAFRFSNGIFEPVWNRRYIDHVQITVAESLGVEQRGPYYDHAGALRDMIPNHLFQLLSYTAMEPPISLEANAVRDEKAKVLRAVREITPEDVLSCSVRGQYDGYRREPKVAPNSSTETYVAMKFMIDNWRWEGVPFYVRTGKKMPTRLSEIAIQFKTAPHIMFHKSQVGPLNPNLLIIHVQPEEGISLRFGAKIPGPIVRIGDVNMKFQYKDYFGARPGTGYETLLYDCMMGDNTLFQRDDMVIFGWQVVQPIIDVWSALAPRTFPNYAPGSWGPKEADDLLARDGRQWRRPTT